MPKCRINGCLPQIPNESISYFSVPCNQPSRKQWIDSIQQHQEFDYYVGRFYVCHLHFQLDDFNTHGSKRTVKRGRLPSIFPSNSTTTNQCKEKTDDLVEISSPSAETRFEDLLSELNTIGSQDGDDNNDLNNLYQCIENTDNLIETSSLNVDAESTSEYPFSELNTIDLQDDDDNNDPNNLDGTTDVVISKEKYKELVENSVGLFKFKQATEQLQKKLKDKSAVIKELRKVIREREYWIKKTKKEMEEKESADKKDETQHENKRECNDSKQLEILKCLKSGLELRKYSPDVRLFCLTLHYYSPRAYEYVRSVFNSNLPTSRSIRSWLSSLDCSPGFTESAFDTLNEMSEYYKSCGEKLIIGLIFDEMKIRSQSQYDPATKTFLGHSNAGKSNEADDYASLSNEALVLMVSGINRSFKIPIGYFLSTGLNGDEKNMILYEAMCKLYKTGVVLASLTFDGHASNISAVQKLGADLHADKPYFTNPFDENTIVFVFLDAPHMIKLIRNCLDRLKIIYDNDCNEVKWEFIQKLINLQSLYNINFCNKLTRNHAEYHNNKMNVRTATQTVSNSTSTAIEFLDKILKISEFAKSEATAHFLRTFNNLFDILNAKLKHTDQKYKRPLSKDTFDEFSAYFKTTNDYIRGLKTIENGIFVPLLKTKSYVPFLGFLNNTTSLVGLYSNHLLKNNICEFYPFTISQDHVELFFGCIRSMGGHNCNPNAQQFTAAYRKLLFQNEVSCSDVGNCQNNVTKLLQVSFVKPKNLVSNENELEKLSVFDAEAAEPLCEEDYYLSDVEINETRIHNDEDHVKSLIDNSTAYLASVLEEKVSRKIELKGRKKCLRCKNVFRENTTLNDKFIAFLSQTKQAKQPCTSTIKIIRLAEDLLKRYESTDVSFQSILTHVVEKIISYSLYESSDFDDQHDHKYDFIRTVIETFFEMRSKLISQQITRINHKTLIRHKNLKEIHFAGQ